MLGIYGLFLVKYNKEFIDVTLAVNLRLTNLRLYVFCMESLSCNK